MIEVEIKVRILDPETIGIKFKNHGGVYKLSLNHEDIYFNMPEGLRDFKETDEALRLRKSIEFNKFDDTVGKRINYYLTYKGKKIDKSTKTREEIDVKIEDIENTRNLLRVLGFQEIFTVKKERELYEFKYKTYLIEALIDYIPILNQYFIEVECLLESSVNLESSRDVLFEFLNLFGIKKEESIRKSYLELIVDKFKDNLRKY
ncbi:MAG: class IV adenylate cyclase [Candidatus Lokiarchaeota archaeon]|nr:class IV adenylate cyclase [Candidatus Lokiarchaeota archaeon]